MHLCFVIFASSLSHDSLLSPVVPQVVKSCADFIEKNGVVDGIYRLSGISSNIQKLRFVPILFSIFITNVGVVWYSVVLGW